VQSPRRQQGVVVKVLKALASLSLVLAAVAAFQQEAVARRACMENPKICEFDPEQEIEDYALCLRVQARLLDDGISDARTIGAAVVRYCRHERAKIVKNKNPDFSDPTFPGNSFYKPATDDDFALGTYIVLQLRAGARKRQQ
jgi:hypothetical protein